VAPDVGQEELERVTGPGRRVGLVHDLFLLLGLVVLGGGALAHLEPDALELAGELLDVDVLEFVLKGERLELGRFDPAALLARLDHRAGALAFKQFCELALGQAAATPSRVWIFQLRTVSDLSCGFQR
jgi:hypothetical protein